MINIYCGATYILSGTKVELDGIIWVLYPLGFLNSREDLRHPAVQFSSFVPSANGRFRHCYDL